MAKKSFLVPVALSIAALVASGPAGATPSPAPVASQAALSNAAAYVAPGALVLDRAVDPSIRLADHMSHSSHESHASHSSHSSHTSGS